MSRWAVIAAAVLAALVVQVALLPAFISPLFKPDLLLIIMVFLALRGEFESGAPLSWGLGLVKDVFGGLYLGLNAFTFLIIFVIIKQISDRLYAESGNVFVVAVSASTLASVLLDLLLLLMFTPAPGIAYSIGSGLIPLLLVNAFCASLMTLVPGFTSPLDAQ